MAPDVGHSGWFAVRCVFRSGRPDSAEPDRAAIYEERITIWQAGTIDEAIAKAEAEAAIYAGRVEDHPDEYLELAQAFELFDRPDHEGAEVFSLLRASALDPPDYLDAFFDTGRERQART